MIRTARSFTAIDLFGGAGGLTEGLKLAGYTVLATVEIDPTARETYSANHPEVGYLFSDIRQLTGREVLEAVGLGVGELDLLAGCPPCQGYSRIRSLNRGSADDDRNDLVLDFVRLVDALKPRSVLMENVPGLASDGRMSEVRRRLGDLGYYVGPDLIRIADAADYGVPQHRRRMILMTTLGGPVGEPPKPAKRVTVREALDGLDAPGSTSDPLHVASRFRARRVRELVTLIPKDGGSRTDLPDGLQLECHKRSTGFSDVYGRMAWDSQAPTITAGCYHPSKGRFLHPDEDRTVTLREAAVLQGFRHDYSFSMSRGKMTCASMIGNALPPPFVMHHARMIRAALEGGTNGRA